MCARLLITEFIRATGPDCHRAGGRDEDVAEAEFKGREGYTMWGQSCL